MPRRPTLTCAGCEKPMWSGRTSLPQGQARCRACRGGFYGKHGVSAYDRGCRCGTCTEAKRVASAAYRARRAAEGRKIDASRPRVERDCLHCGERFAARKDHVERGGGKFCSRVCQNRAANAARGFKPRPPRKSAVRRRAERVAAKAAAGSTGGNRVWVQGACLICRANFMSPGAASRYCSAECRKVSRDRRNWISYPERLALYQRDDYMCHICGESTSREYDSSDPWSPTLDHLVPRALGGGDEPSNLATAHLWCNSVRGDLTYFSDGDLAEV